MAEILIEAQEAELTEALKSIIEKAVLTAAGQEGVPPDFEVSVTLCNNDIIHRLNRQHRGIDRETDVLSFPILEFEDGRPVYDAGDYEGDTLLLGDIIISLEKATEQAESYGHSLAREVGFLTVHSMLHLLGYDHMEENEAAAMRSREKTILKEMDLRRE